MRNQNEEMIQLLVRYKADVNIKDEFGKTAFMESIILIILFIENLEALL